MNMSTGGQADAVGLARTPRASGWRLWLSPTKLWANRMGVIGGGIFLLFLLCGIFAPWIARTDPNAVSLGDRFRYPTLCNALPWVQTYEPEEGQIVGAVFCHPDIEERKGFLGTDKLGRDLLSRLIHGARIAMIVALSASALSGVIGISIGIATAYYGGLVDDVIMRIADTWDSVPPIVIMLALLAFIPGGVVTLIILLGRRGRRMDRHGPDRARGVVEPAETGLRTCRPGARSQRQAGNVPAHPAKHDGPHHRRQDHGHRRRDPGRVGAELPRAGSSGRGAVVGQHADRGPGVHPGGLGGRRYSPASS